ncbi:hypothetical protein AVEN_157885-1 [Araneus ventricosus]|uniref:Uncharacterized protein n=1 Tax=Araneus ventricosus TaxID=182803 RepID=A0A4Y2RTA2_ARAVE|nr:hypothetical protein AVEN_57115-1 [Araneus ventricosus]GBN78165.1 hypothetical protein AVEN_198116-1 [Araneus ventricosus]GBN78266.1 hypothetical protein AVEN_138560-1 [Araneus ventricosus]GBN78275.1 hypothetical protein AVEN_157885-1 [Araneus ventricosus]
MRQLKRGKAQLRFPAVPASSPFIGQANTHIMQISIQDSNNSPDKILTVRTESRLLEKPRNEFVVLDHRNVLFFQSTFSDAAQLEITWCLSLTIVCHLGRPTTIVH